MNAIAVAATGYLNPPGHRRESTDQGKRVKQREVCASAFQWDKFHINYGRKRSRPFIQIGRILM